MKHYKAKFYISFLITFLFFNVYICQEKNSYNNSIYGNGITLIPTPYFAIKDYEIIKLTEEKMEEACPESDVYGNTGPDICKKKVSAKQYFKKNNEIYLFAGVDFSFQGGHWEQGKNGFIILKYLNNNWVVHNFFELIQNENNWGNSLSFKKTAELGKNSIAFFYNSFAEGFGIFNSQVFIVGIYNLKIQLMYTGLLWVNDEASYDQARIDYKGYPEQESKEYQYEIIKSNQEWYNIKQTEIKNSKKISSKQLIFNPNTGSYK